MTGYPNSCYTQKLERGQTGPRWDKWKLKGDLLTLMSCDPFPDTGTSFFASIWFFSIEQLHSVSKFCHNMIFYALQVSVDYAVAEKPEKLFWRRLKNKLLHLRENHLNTWRVEGLSVLVVKKTWLYQPVREKIFWGDGSSVCTTT